MTRWIYVDGLVRIVELSIYTNNKEHLIKTMINGETNRSRQIPRN